MSKQLYGDKSFSSDDDKIVDQEVKIEEINKSMENKTIRVIARVSRILRKGKLCFVRLRRTPHSIQGCFFVKSDEEKEMMKYITSITVESIVEIVGVVRVSKSNNHTSNSDMELEIKEMYCLSKSIKLGGELDDYQITRKMRCLALRNSVFHHIFKLQSLIGRKFCEFMYSKDFIEIHTPHIVKNQYEEYRSSFTFDYFGTSAQLTNNSQLYHQLAIQGGLDKVFEISTAFEKFYACSNRHLMEKITLNFGMIIASHFHEIIAVVKELLNYIFDQISEYEGLDMILKYEKVKFSSITEKLKKEEILVLSLQEVHELLDANFVEFDLFNENRIIEGLNKLFKDYTEIIIIHNIGMPRHGCFDMPGAVGTDFNNFIIVVGGMVVGSGCQYIHDEELLKQQIHDSATKIPDLVSALKYGAQPCGGCSIDLEAFLMKFLILVNIRYASLFPRVQTIYEDELLL